MSIVPSPMQPLQFLQGYRVRIVYKPHQSSNFKMEKKCVAFRNNLVDFIYPGPGPQKEEQPSVFKRLKKCVVKKFTGNSNEPEPLPQLPQLVLEEILLRTDYETSLSMRMANRRLYKFSKLNHKIMPRKPMERLCFSCVSFPERGFYMPRTRETARKEKVFLQCGGDCHQWDSARLHSLCPKMLKLKCCTKMMSMFEPRFFVGVEALGMVLSDRKHLEMMPRLAFSVKRLTLRIPYDRDIFELNINDLELNPNLKVIRISDTSTRGSIHILPEMELLQTFARKDPNCPIAVSMFIANNNIQHSFVAGGVESIVYGLKCLVVCNWYCMDACQAIQFSMIIKNTKIDIEWIERRIHQGIAISRVSEDEYYITYNPPSLRMNWSTVNYIRKLFRSNACPLNYNFGSYVHSHLFNSTQHRLMVRWPSIRQ